MQTHTFGSSPGVQAPSPVRHEQTSAAAHAGRATQLGTETAPAGSVHTPPGGVRHPQSAYTGVEMVGPLDAQCGAQSAAVSQCGGGGHQEPSGEQGIPICGVQKQRWSVSATQALHVASALHAASFAGSTVHDGLKGGDSSDWHIPSSGRHGSPSTATGQA